jgi:hypothetical protein
MGTQVIIDHILRNINMFIGSSGLKETLDGVKKLDTKLVVPNNSFFFREKTYIKTNKSDKYLAFLYRGMPVQVEDCIVIKGVNLNSDYQILNRGDLKITEQESLIDAVNIEIDKLGSLVFVLLGEIDDSVVVKADINHKLLRRVVLNPLQEEFVCCTGDELICKNVDDEEMIWTEIQHALLEQFGYSEELLEDLKGRLGAAFDHLKSESFCNLIIPRKLEAGKRYFLDVIEGSLAQTLESYSTAIKYLSSLASDRRQAFNEVLRIAYNFTDDAITLIRLLVSVCDLKPLIFWGTFVWQYMLVESIRNLPWTREERKPSLSTYIDTIRKARNRTYHRLFPFSKPFEVLLPDRSLQNVRLRIFSEHGSKKKSNTMEFQDKQLVDLLMEFTRTAEEIVSEQFWEKNAGVIECTATMIREISGFLKACFETKAGS